jgi:hypothetical protein
VATLLHDLGFATVDQSRVGGQQASIETLVAVCVQGIRVETFSPGFGGHSIMAISNVTGQLAPATNVARSSFEAGKALNAMFLNIYRVYAEHITSEIHRLLSNRSASPSEAASEGRYMLGPLQAVPPSALITDGDAVFRTVMRTIPLLTVDEGDLRSLATLDDIAKLGAFWTVEGSAYGSAEMFVRRVPGDLSVAKVAALTNAPVTLPIGNIVAGYSSHAFVLGLLAESFDVDQICIKQSERQVDYRWRPVGPARLWRAMLPVRKDARQRIEQLQQVFSRGFGGRMAAIFLQNSDEVVVEGADGECGVKSSTRVYLFAGSDIHEFMRNRLDALETGAEEASNYALMGGAIGWLLSVGEDLKGLRQRVLEQFRQQIIQQTNVECTVSPEFSELFLATDSRLFDPTRGDRRRLPLGGLDIWD